MRNTDLSAAWATAKAGRAVLKPAQPEPTGAAGAKILKGFILWDTSESGRGQPHSKTLRAVARVLCARQRLGVRLSSAAFSGALGPGAGISQSANRTEFWPAWKSAIQPVGKSAPRRVYPELLFTAKKI